MEDAQFIQQKSDELTKGKVQTAFCYESPGGELFFYLTKGVRIGLRLQGFVNVKASTPRPEINHRILGPGDCIEVEQYGTCEIVEDIGLPIRLRKTQPIPYLTIFVYLHQGEDKLALYLNKNEAPLLTQIGFLFATRSEFPVDIHPKQQMREGGTYYANGVGNIKVESILQVPDKYLVP